MKAPLLFGLSDTSNIATGNVGVGNNSEQISVSETGSVTTGVGSSGTGVASAGSMLTMTYNNVVWPWTLDSFSFDLGTKTSEDWNVYQSAMTGDFGIYGDNHHLLTKTGVGYLDLGMTGLSSVTSVPTTGYGTSNGTAHVVAGHSYAFKLAGGAYGAIEIISTTVPVTTLRYKYSASGASFN